MNIVIQGESVPVAELKETLEGMIGQCQSVKEKYGSVPYPCLNRTLKLVVGNLAKICLILAGKAQDCLQVQEHGTPATAGIFIPTALELFQQIHTGYTNLVKCDQLGSCMIFDDFEQPADNSIDEGLEAVRQHVVRLRQAAATTTSLQESAQELLPQAEAALQESTVPPVLTDEQVESQIKSLHELLLRVGDLTEADVSEFLKGECGSTLEQQRDFLVSTQLRQNMCASLTVANLTCEACEEFTIWPA